MSNVIFTPNMNLPQPVPGQDPGPDWANEINASTTILDQHNHSAGSGVQITPAGINVNVDLPMNNNNLTLIRSLRLNPQMSPLSSPTDLGCLYESGVDLYYNDGNGNQVRITQSGSVAGSSGTITGLPSGTASASYGAGTFVFQSATNTPANIDGESFILRNNAANSKGLTLNPPNAMGANYSLTLPPLPSVISIVTLDTSGNLVGSLVTDNATLTTVSSGTLAVATAGIQTANIANGAVTSAKLASGIIQTHQVFSSSTTFTVPTGVNVLTWTLVGAGGGGGGGEARNGGGAGGGGGGGGAAGQVFTQTINTTPGTVWTITVGTSGSGGSGGNPGGGTGGTGGSSSVTDSVTNIIAGGGAGGNGGTIFSSPGQTGGNGGAVMQWSTGFSPAIGGSSASGVPGTAGGNAPFSGAFGHGGAGGGATNSGSPAGNGGSANGVSGGTGGASTLSGGAGGAGGSLYRTGTGGTGGNGGTNGGSGPSGGGSSTDVGSGGGGGGGGSVSTANGASGGAGFGGVVIVFYQTST